jgi:uncharacterized DUF497 family protein
MGLIFEWDSKKAIRNHNKHGVSFTQASSVFGDLLLVTIPDEKHSIEERRYFSLGEDDGGRLLAVAHTIDGDTIRIISARPATASERRDYEEGG